jgi:hypothetical protein
MVNILWQEPFVSTFWSTGRRHALEEDEEREREALEEALEDAEDG